MDQSSIWNEVAHQGFSSLVMGVFVYVAYTYFTRQLKEIQERTDRQLAEKDRIIADKDAKIQAILEQQIETAKLNVETWANLMSAINKLSAKIDSKN